MARRISSTSTPVKVAYGQLKKLCDPFDCLGITVPPEAVVRIYRGRRHTTFVAKYLNANGGTVVLKRQVGFPFFQLMYGLTQ